MSITYQIIPTAKVVRHGTPQGWRKWAAKLGLPVRRPTLVVDSDDGCLYCHPDSVASLCRFMTANRLVYTVMPESGHSPLASVSPIRKPTNVILPDMH